MHKMLSLSLKSLSLFSLSLLSPSPPQWPTTALARSGRPVAPLFKVLLAPCTVQQAYRILVIVLLLHCIGPLFLLFLCHAKPELWPTLASAAMLLRQLHALPLRRLGPLRLLLLPLIGQLTLSLR